MKNINSYSLGEYGVGQGLHDLSLEPHLELSIGELGGLLKHLIGQLLVNVPNIGSRQTR